MRKVTIYVPDDLKQDISAAAGAEGRSEAEFIRAALRSAVARVRAPRPRLPLVSGTDPALAEKVDEALSAGFGLR